jgi:Ca2+-binding RTX toxin-like protein
MTTVTYDGSKYIWQGTADAEVIQGYSHQDNWIYGAGGNDTLRVGRNAEGNYLFGEDGNDELIGGHSSDHLTGGSGADTLRGGPGNDANYITDYDDVIVERARWEPVGTGGDTVVAFIDYELNHVAIEILILREGSAAVNGTGNRLDNRILGNSANNILDGGRGIDRLEGREGDDIYFLRHKRDVAFERYDDQKPGPAAAAAGGHDTVWAHNSFRLARGIEDIVLQEVTTSSGALKHGLSAIGNGHANAITGNA